MKSHYIVILALCAGFSAYASAPNTPSAATNGMKNVDWQSLLTSSALIGGGYGLYRQHMKDLRNYGYGLRNYGNYAPLAKFPSGVKLVVGGTLITSGFYTGLNAFRKWYDSNSRSNDYYPTKR